MPDDLGTFELTEPVVNLSARYYRFRWSGPRVKKVTFQNFYKDVPNAHVWAIKQIGADWKEPEDWSRLEQVEQIRQVGLEAGWLLHAIYQKNTHQNGSAVFKGPQTLDAARIQDNIPVGPGQALQILQGAPDTARFMTPEVQQALKKAQAAMDRNARENSGKLVYTFDWELKPMSGTPPSP